MTSSTRSSRGSRGSSPVTEQPAPTGPLTPNDLTQLCTVVRENLPVKPGEKPSMRVQATYRRKDEPDVPLKVVDVKLRKEGLYLWGVWEDEPTKEYPFPHPELEYHLVKLRNDLRTRTGSEGGISAVQGGVNAGMSGPQVPIPPGMSSQLPDSTISGNVVRGVQGFDEGMTGAGATPIMLDPNLLDPYEPLTYDPWFRTFDDDGFRTRDLIRELRDAPEFGLRANQYFQDRTFVKQQKRNFNGIFRKWIILARQTPGIKVLFWRWDEL